MPPMPPQPAPGAALVVDGYRVDGDEIPQRYKRSVREFVGTLTRMLRSSTGSTAVVTLVGHTDSSGTELHNTPLGLNRALGVARALQKLMPQQVASQVRYVTRSAGESSPVAPNVTTRDRARNRRVVVQADVTITVAPKPKARPPSRRPKLTKAACIREMDSITLLRPWEQRFLEVVISPPDKEAFAGATLWIGTRALGAYANAIPVHERVIVRTALASPDTDAITLCPNIWFRSPLDTSIPKHLALLVHEAVHLRDCHYAGLDAFIRSYMNKWTVSGYRNMPDEVGATRFEDATKRLLTRFPALAGVISSCDDDAIMRDLNAHASVYRAAFNGFL